MSTAPAVAIGWPRVHQRTLLHQEVNDGEPRAANLASRRVDAPTGLIVLSGPQSSPRDRHRSLAVAQAIEGIRSGRVDQPGRRRLGQL
jgi:hypothetical protein